MAWMGIRVLTGEKLAHARESVHNTKLEHELKGTSVVLCMNFLALACL